jgi:hypothetical protein
LDACLVRTPQLRSDLQKFQLSRPGNSESRREYEFAVAENIINQAQGIENSLIAWAESLPPDWNYTVSPGYTNSPSAPDEVRNHAVYGNVVNLYPSLDQARTWNLYRAARLMTNGIIAGLPAFRSVGYAGPKYSAQQDIAKMNVRKLADEICASVPYHYEVKSTAARGLDSAGQTTSRNIQMANTANITSREAFILVFPLCSAVVMSGIPENQRAWLRSQILLMSKITGSYGLEKVAKGL